MCFKIALNIITDKPTDKTKNYKKSCLFDKKNWAHVFLSIFWITSLGHTKTPQMGQQTIGVDWSFNLKAA